jgi:hypothetical protein
MSEMQTGNIHTAAKYAEKNRTAPAGSMRSSPPSGPKPAGQKLNGTPAPRVSGVK